MTDIKIIMMPFASMPPASYKRDNNNAHCNMNFQKQKQAKSLVKFQSFHTFIHASMGSFMFASKSESRSNPRACELVARSAQAQCHRCGTQREYSKLH
jgi:hypothetical protein